MELILRSDLCGRGKMKDNQHVRDVSRRDGYLTQFDKFNMASE